MLAYDENGEKLCLTGSECVNKGAVFTYGFYHCKSAVQCTLDGLYPYIIGNSKQCRRESPIPDGRFDKELAEQGIYKCADPQMYPDFSSGKVRCIREQDCKGLFRKGLMCLSEDQCYA